MRDPDLTGPGVCGWKVAYSDATLEAHRREWGSEPAGISTWIINGPYHPLWSWWMIGTVHLREEEGTRPPVLHYAGATHEISCFSFDPTDGKRPDIDRLEQGDLTARPPFLTPPDWVVQFIVADDDQALLVSELVARAIVERGWSCDSDYRERWESTIARTAEHVRLGEHPDDRGTVEL